MKDIVRWNPFRDLTDLRKRFGIGDDMFDVFGDFFNLPDRGFKMDIWEDESFVNIKAELPGVNKDDITIELNNEILTISVCQKEEKTSEDPTRKYHRKEISSKSYTRQIQVLNVEEDKIDASHKDGFLNITIPKKATASVPVKKIDIK